MARLNPMKKLWLYPTQIIHTGTHWLKATEKSNDNSLDEFPYRKWIPAKWIKLSYELCVVGRCLPDQMKTILNIVALTRPTLWIIFLNEVNAQFSDALFFIFCVFCAVCFTASFVYRWDWSEIEFAFHRKSNDTFAKGSKQLINIFTECLLEIRQPKHNFNRDAS